MNEDILAYIVVGGVFIGAMIPLIGLLVHYTRENKLLEEGKRIKKYNTPQEIYSIVHDKGR